MCKVGGPRCSGSNVPSPAQRARRKASTAYRRAVADAVRERTGDNDLAARVARASVTDMHDIAAVARLDENALAAAVGTATYTASDGTTAEVPATPTGRVRRTPATEGTRKLLEDLDKATGALAAVDYRDAVLAADRSRATVLRDEADAHIGSVRARAAALDPSTATDDELAALVADLDGLYEYSENHRGVGIDWAAPVSDHADEGTGAYAPDLAYQEGHMAPGYDEDGVTTSLSDLAAGTGNMPNDALDHPDWYGAEHAETIDALRRVTSPDDLVTIYRAVPDTVHHINSGDWVALSRAYAQGHADGGNITGQDQGHIISAQVPAKYLFTEDSLEEWGLDAGFHIDTRDGSRHSADSADAAPDTRTLADVHDAVLREQSRRRHR